MHYVMELVDNELSEPYSIFTYRYCTAITVAAFTSEHTPHAGAAMSARPALADVPCDRQVLPAQLAQAVLAGL